MNSLLKMVIQGLNPAKNQCYFVVFGTKLVLMRSYFGSIHVAKSVDERIEDIVADVVYEGDEFEYEKLRGKTRITTHKQKLENIEKAKIKAAYATVIYKDGRDESVIMTIDEIKQAWKQSNIHPIDDKGNIKLGTVHDKFMAEMAKKSVINRICKPIFNGSDDSNLVAYYAKQTDADLVEAEVEEEIAEKANQELIDVEVEPERPEEALPEPQKQISQNKKQPDVQGTIFSPTGTEGPGF
jgi:recombination protein RecT